MRNEIVLIGPMNIGKSSIAEVLSQRLNMPHVQVDKIRFPYYEEIGYDHEMAEQQLKEHGFIDGLFRYWRPFELHAIKRVLSEYKDCIFDFGAGHSVYDDEEMLSEAKELLGDFKNVILLLPTEDIDESMQFYRDQRDTHDEGMLEMNRFFITHRSNHALCKHIVYVKDKAKEDIADEICAIYNAK